DRNQSLEQILPQGQPALPRLGARAAVLPAGAPPLATIHVGARAPVRVVPVHFKKGAEASKVLTELSGIVVAHLLREPKPQLTVPDVLNAAGRSVMGADGGVLRVTETTKTDAGRIQVRVTIDPPASGAQGGRPDRAASRAGRAVLST